MALEGEFLTEVQEYVAELTARDGIVILDAATGAGETTLQIAEAMNGGKLITVDSDLASWNAWAKPSLEKAGLLDRVEFLEADMRDLPLEAESVDLIVSDATLSALGIFTVEAIQEFRRVLRPTGRLALRGLIPEKETETDSRNISALSWRLMKAAAHLAGEEHYDELPTDWVRARLKEAGFEIISFRVNPSRPAASKTSYEEWRGMDIASAIVDQELQRAFRDAQRRLVERARKEGLTCKTGHYTCWMCKTDHTEGRNTNYAESS